jgi:hypothetical protein
VIRAVAAAAIVFVALWALGAAVAVSTGCTEPGDCTAAGELARDHGFAIAVAGSLVVLVVGVAARRGRRR